MFGNSGILVGIATTLQTTTGQAFGARNFEEVSLSLQRCTLLCLVMLGLIAALWLSSEPLLLAVGQEKAVAALAARYLKYLLPGVCCYLVTQCSQNWLAAQRMTGVQATGGLILAAVYLPLCWTLVHPLQLGCRKAIDFFSSSLLFLMPYALDWTKPSRNRGS